MRIVHSSFSGDYVRIIVHFGAKEHVVAFGPIAPPLPHEATIKEPLVAEDVDTAITEIISQTGRPEDDVRYAAARYLSDRRFTVPEDWYERFKAAGGRGRVDGEKVWFSKSVPQPSEASETIAELIGPDKEEAYKQVLAYLKARYRGFVGWADV